MIFAALSNWLIAKAQRTPYSHLYRPDGSAYMERYWLVPYRFERALTWWKAPLGWLLQRFDIAVRVHHICERDADRVMHDHPWGFISVVLRGWYYEERPLRDVQPFYPLTGTEPKRLSFRKKGSSAFRRAGDRHLICAVAAGGVWTLFITFKYQQGWGFYTPHGKVPWREYESAHHKEEL